VVICTPRLINKKQKNPLSPSMGPTGPIDEAQQAHSCAAAATVCRIQTARAPTTALPWARSATSPRRREHVRAAAGICPSAVVESLHTPWICATAGFVHRGCHKDGDLLTRTIAGPGANWNMECFHVLLFSPMVEQVQQGVQTWYGDQIQNELEHTVIDKSIGLSYSYNLEQRASRHSTE
jgi:hypothetical protein